MEVSCLCVYAPFYLNMQGVEVNLHIFWTLGLDRVGGHLRSLCALGTRCSMEVVSMLGIKTWVVYNQ